MPKQPTQDDYLKFDGGGCHKIWQATTEDWRCPSCERSKFEILRWTRRQANSRREAGMDWYAALHWHHDHVQGKNVDVGNGRFKKTLICDHCNSADGAAKKKLKLPSKFSFSPQEIRLFIQATPHEKHSIDLDKAKEVYQAYQSLQLRRT